MSNSDDIKDLFARVEALEAKSTGGSGAGVGSILVFNRPRPDAAPFGLGWRMSAPDPVEAVKRACFAVNYQGGLVHEGEALDEVWDEIERLKVADPKLLPLYAKVDPAMAGFALLTGLVSVSKWDPMQFGKAQEKRDALAGFSIASWLEQEFAVRGTVGIGGE